MYILYLDDAGSPANANEKHFVLGGFVVFERQVYYLNKQLEGLAETLCPDMPGSVEFHASEIFSGRKSPWKELGKAERIGVIKSVLQVVRDAHDSTRLFACVVHKASFPGRDPVEVAFEDLCSRFDLFIKRINILNQEDHRGIIILDKSTKETSLQSLAVNFRFVGMRWGKVMRNLAEVPLFVDSTATRLIQLADHIAYSVFRRYEALDAAYFDPIVSRFDSEKGKIHGLIHLPRGIESYMCPACMSRALSD